MSSFVSKRATKVVSLIVAIAFCSAQVGVMAPPDARAAAADDLKTIKYKYYFRGSYDKAIAELRTFLERDDLTEADRVEAKEYLAASLILSGAPAEGKAQYLELLKQNGDYGGPDPSVFKPVIISAFEEAKSEYASMVIRTVPETAMPQPASDTAPAETEVSKPIYKKWWFYAGLGAALLVLAAAAGGGEGDDTGGDADTGRVTIEVGVP